MKTLLLTIAVIALTGFLFGSDIKQIIIGKQTGKKEKSKKKHKDYQKPGSEVSVVNKWDLPAELVEVSGIAFLDKERFACVQDEKGTIYIFNTSTGAIEKQIDFAGPGDFEGIAVNGNTAYVVRADGQLFEVDMASRKTTEYKTGFTVENDIENLCYDQKNNRLLLAGKEPDVKYPGYKAIYAFNLSSKTITSEPVYKIALESPLLKSTANKKDKGLMPSSINIHPTSGEIYITDGPSSRLLRLDANARLQKVYTLGNEFPKSEGISFSPGGDMYISNEGKKVPGNIIQTALK